MLSLRYWGVRKNKKSIMTKAKTVVKNDVVNEKSMVEKTSKKVVEEDVFDELEFEEQTDSKYSEVYFARPRTKDAAYWEFSKKAGDVYKVDKRTSITSIDGELLKFEFGSFTFENKEIKTLKMHISKVINDKLILFIINFTYSQVTRSIINSLIAMQEEVKKISMSLYVNKAGWASVFVKLNDKPCKWELSIEDQKEYIETIKNKKGEFISNDYSSLDDEFESRLQKHQKVLLPDVEPEGVTFVEVSADSVLGEENTDDLVGDDYFDLDN